MGNWKLIRTKDYDALQSEIKGFYEETEKQNIYLSALEKQLQGLRLPNMNGISREQIRNIYETSAPVMGVVNYIAENVGEVATYLELTKDGEPVEKHPLVNTLRRPNDRYSLRKLVMAWAVNRLLFGDAWVYAPMRIGKDGGRSLYVIPSQKVAVQNGKPIFEGIQLLGMGKADTIPATEVFESFDYNLDDTSLFGTSKVAAAAYYLSVMEKGIKRQDKTLEEGGATHLITPKPDATGSVMPKDAAEIEKLANGKGSIGKRRALQFPVEVHQLGSTPVDLSILDSHKEAVTALCFVFRLPVDLYYGQAKYENAKEAKKTIYEQNAIPMANEFAEDLLRFLKLDAEGYELRVNTDYIDVLKESTGEVLDNLGKMHATLNEMREAYGYDRIEEDWADKPILPMGVTFGNEFDDINETDGL
jgi:HK97 family phage portal protein